MFGISVFSQERKPFAPILLQPKQEGAKTAEQRHYSNVAVWKPGTEKPRLLDDEEGGVLFFGASPSTSSGYHSSSLFYLFIYLFNFSSNLNCGGGRHGYSNTERQKQSLPVYKYRTAILYLVETRATTIIVGETGSGKTTQIPQV